MAKGTPSGDSGERQRLEPKDIELKEHSDIVYNFGAASRFDDNIAAIKTLKKIESEGRRATLAIFACSNSNFHYQYGLM